MKKKSYIYSVILVMLMFIFSNSVFASTNTTERTEDNLQIWDTISVTSRVKKAALATPKVNETEKIYDFAELLTASEERALKNKIDEFIEKYEMDMVVVTIEENNKKSAMEYADDFYDYNYFGIGNTYDGILMLIDMDNREVWISTTGHAILVYDDIRINRMLDYIQNELIDANYLEATNQFIYFSKLYASSGVASSNANMEIDENGNYVKRKNTLQFKSIGDFIIYFIKIAIFPTIITVVIILIGVNSHKNVKVQMFARPYLERNSLNINLRRDTFIRTHTNRVRMSSDSSGGGGSSSHHSSSGRSHGGGGRHF